MQNEFLERLNIRNNDAQQVISFTSHQITLHDFRPLKNGIFKNLQCFLDLFFKCNLDEHADLEPNLERIEQRDVATDVTSFFEGSYPRQTR